MSKLPWDSDIEVTEDLVKLLIEAQFAELRPVNIRSMGAGWDNKAFLINQRWVFRFPHRDIAAALIERENTLLVHLQDKIQLAIPNPVYMGKPCQQYPYHFQGYAIIPGKSGCRVRLTESERGRSIVPIAQFLKQLHSISEPQARALGADNQLFDRTEVVKIVEAFKTRMQKIIDKNIVKICEASIQDELDKVLSVQLSKTRVLVHGDLYCRHLMFEEQRLVGVIDWGDVGINHPAVDLSVVFSFYPREFHDDFFEIYGAIDAQTSTYARFLGLYSAISVLLYGYEVNDRDLVDEAKDALTRINPNLQRAT